jgi:hypothetical protein
MTLDPHRPAHDRHAELVVELSGVGAAHAHHALHAARARNGDHGDQLLNIAEAIISLRSGTAEVSTAT